MSTNPQTNYNLINPSGTVLDLSNIFQPILTGNTPVSPTGYTVFVNNDEKDLNELFYPNTGITQLAYNTGYMVNGFDLSYLFAPFAYVATGAYSVTTSSSYNTILTFTAGGSLTMMNSELSSSIGYVAVGGGSGGSGYYTQTVLFATQYFSGSGGGGGQVLSGTTTLQPGVTYTINVGSGGVGGPGGATNINSGNGSSSSVTYGSPSTALITAKGGYSIVGGSQTNYGGSATLNTNTEPNSCNGGNGISTPLGTFGGGGGGGASPYNYQGGSGGLGGGGNGGYMASIFDVSHWTGQAGAANTGGGGGGGMYPSVSPGSNGGSGGNGGSGVVIFYFNI